MSVPETLSQHGFRTMSCMALGSLVGALPCRSPGMCLSALLSIDSLALERLLPCMCSGPSWSRPTCLSPLLLRLARQICLINIKNSGDSGRQLLNFTFCVPTKAVAHYCAKSKDQHSKTTDLKDPHLHGLLPVLNKSLLCDT